MLRPSRLATSSLLARISCSLSSVSCPSLLRPRSSGRSRLAVPAVAVAALAVVPVAAAVVSPLAAVVVEVSAAAGAAVVSAAVAVSAVVDVAGSEIAQSTQKKEENGKKNGEPR